MGPPSSPRKSEIRPEDKLVPQISCHVPASVHYTDIYPFGPPLSIHLQRPLSPLGLQFSPSVTMPDSPGLSRANANSSIKGRALGRSPAAHTSLNYSALMPERSRQEPQSPGPEAESGFLASHSVVSGQPYNSPALSREMHSVGTTLHNVTSPKPVDVAHSKELMRIHQLWTDSKRELRDARQQLADAELRHSTSVSEMKAAHREQVAQLQALLAQMNDKVLTNEAEFVNYDAELVQRSNHADDLKAQLHQVTSELVSTKEQLEVQTALTQSQGREVAALVERLRAADQDKTHALGAAAEEQSNLHAEVRRRDDAITDLERRRVRYDDELADMGDRLNDAHVRIQSLEKMIAREKKANEKLESDLAGARYDLKVHLESTATERQLKKTIAEYKRDNGRLLEMLSQTEQFSAFLEHYSDPSKQTYVPKGSAVPKNKGRQLSRVYALQDDRIVQPKREYMYWVPNDAFKLADDFRAKHLPHFPTSFFADLLIKLNQVWHQREQRKLTSLKGKYVGEIKDLKRRLSQKMPAEQVMQKASIRHLKKELKKARKSTTKVGAGPNLDGGSAALLTTSLRAVDELARTVSDTEATNRRLVTKLGVHDEARLTGLDTASFLEGAASVGRLAVRVTEQAWEHLTNIVVEYRTDVKNLKRDEDVYVNAVKLQINFMERFGKAISFHRLQVQKMIKGVYKSVGAEEVDDSDSDFEDELEPAIEAWAADSESRSEIAGDGVQGH